MTKVRRLAASGVLVAIALLLIAYKSSRTRQFWIGGALILAMTYGATISLALVTPEDAERVQRASFPEGMAATASEGNGRNPRQ